MASIRLKRINKDGSKVYEIRASLERGKGQKSLSWTAPAGWSQKYIDRELKKTAEEFDRKVKAGEILTKADQAARDQAAAEQAASIKTVKQYAESIYIPGKEGQCAYRTVEYYKATLERYIYPVIGNIKMTEVRSVMLKNIIQKAQNQGYSYSTVRGIYLTLAQIFDQANKDDVIDINPMAKVSSPRRKKDESKNEIEIFTDIQLKIIRECLENEPLKWRTLFNVMMDTGARKGEICAIKWENIDFTTGTIIIDSNAINTRQPGIKGDKVIVSRPKNGKSRIVLISSETIQMLQNLRVQNGSFDYAFIQLAIEDGKPVNRPVSPQSVDHYLRKFAQKYNLDFKIHPHKFRHTAATKLLQSGVPLQDAARLIGDNPETLVRFYLHSNDDAVMRAAMILHSAIGRDIKYIPDKSQTKMKKSHTKRKLLIVGDNGN